MGGIPVPAPPIVVCKPFEPSRLPEGLNDFGAIQMTKAESYRRAFDNLRQAFLEEVPEKVGAIRRAAEEAGRGSAAIETLQQLVHRLVGSAEIFGLARLSDAARVLEERVNALLESSGGSDAALRRQLVDLVSGLERAWSEESRPEASLRKVPRRSRSGRL
jgi:HPt (histidine-containing phosphotransfer) domain-containing protein